MSDLVQRLRSKRCCDASRCNCDEAADEIERLRAEVLELRLMNANYRLEGRRLADQPAVPAEFRGIARRAAEQTARERCQCGNTRAVCDHTRCGHPVAEFRTPDQPPAARNYEDPAYALAMLGLQSDRYGADPDFRDAVDDVLAVWKTADKSADQPL